MGKGGNQAEADLDQDQDRDQDQDNAMENEDELTAKNTQANSSAVQTSKTPIEPKKRKKMKKKPAEPMYLPDGTLNYHMGTNSGKGPDDPDVPPAFKRLEQQGTYVSSVRTQYRTQTSILVVSNISIFQTTYLKKSLKHQNMIIQSS